MVVLVLLLRKGIIEYGYYVHFFLVGKLNQQLKRAFVGSHGQKGSAGCLLSLRKGPRGRPVAAMLYLPGSKAPCPEGQREPRSKDPGGGGGADVGHPSTHA